MSGLTSIDGLPVVTIETFDSANQYAFLDFEDSPEDIAAKRRAANRALEDVRHGRDPEPRDSLGWGPELGEFTEQDIAEATMQGCRARVTQMENGRVHPESRAGERSIRQAELLKCVPPEKVASAQQRYYVKSLISSLTNISDPRFSKRSDPTAKRLINDAITKGGMDPQNGPPILADFEALRVAHALQNVGNESHMKRTESKAVLEKGLRSDLTTESEIKLAEQTGKKHRPSEPRAFFTKLLGLPVISLLFVPIVGWIIFFFIVAKLEKHIAPKATEVIEDPFAAKVAASQRKLWSWSAVIEK